MPVSNNYYIFFYKLLLLFRNIGPLNVFIFQLPPMIIGIVKKNYINGLI